MVLEYKYDFDALLRDFEKSIKFPEHINLVVCWAAGGAYRKLLTLKSLLIDDGGTSRVIFGSTHSAYLVGQYAKPVFEVVILEDLYRFLLNPIEEAARQRLKYAAE
jgi:hypothetical protein